MACRLSRRPTNSTSTALCASLAKLLDHSNSEGVELEKSCTWYRGSLRILHANACTSNDITVQVIDALRNITSTDFSEAENVGAVQITDVEFTDAPSLDKEIIVGTIRVLRFKESRSAMTSKTV